MYLLWHMEEKKNLYKKGESVCLANNQKILYSSRLIVLKPPFEYLNMCVYTIVLKPPLFGSRWQCQLDISFLTSGLLLVLTRLSQRCIYAFQEKKNLYDFTFYGHFFSKFYFFILLKKIKIATNIILPEYGRLCRNVGDGTIRVCLIMLFQ